MNLEPFAKRERWTEERAWQWHAGQPWLVGCNYIPRHACNQLEMWQAETFDADQIEQELDWAEGLGFNSLRVFLHDLAWRQDPDGFLDRVDRFLAIAARHGIGVMPVLFDSCWHPFPRAGRQREPEPGVHNAGWVQSPGVAVLRDRRRFAELEPYVKAVISRFRADTRVQVWDLWNEPDNNNAASRGCRDIANKGGIVAPLLAEVFAWAREADPVQPLTSGVWQGPYAPLERLAPWQRVQIEQSDVVSFHSYDPPLRFRERIAELRTHGRPLLCTEYMARSTGSEVGVILPIAKAERVAAYNWGFVRGRTQTHLPWSTWQEPCEGGEPPLWFHELLHADGSPYRTDEVEVIRRLTGAHG